MNVLTIFQFSFLITLFSISSTYLVLRIALRLLGLYLIYITKDTRQLLLSRLSVHDNTTTTTSNNNKESPFIVGFLHPFCNAGGGGERVLWAAIRSTQIKYPQCIAVVYTGDHDANKETILTRAKERFDIDIDHKRILFLYLDYRNLVSPELYPYFTLLLQSLGSLPLVYSAFSLLVPDIFIDTMGYPFAYPFAKALFGKKKIPVAAYVHYPTISTDMLDSLENVETEKSLKKRVKKVYWRLFAKLYGTCGGFVDVVVVNSTWTAKHISQLWVLEIEKDEEKWKHKEPDRRTVKIIYPPCSVERIISSIPLNNNNTTTKRNPHILYIAQFRPEKRHELILQSFAKFLKETFPSSSSSSSSTFPHDKSTVKLLLLGSVRSTTDTDTKLVYSLRILARELSIQDHVEFITDASYSQVLHYLSNSSVGTNAMWNEHFGIGIVEYLAAGLICVVHDSGGPKEDIVENGRTGWTADGIGGFAEGFRKALEVSGDEEEEKRMRERCRESSKRFGEQVFEEQWVGVMERLLGLMESWDGNGRRR